MELLSSYQNPEGKLKDRLAPRTDLRLDMIDYSLFKNETVLDIGCNNGYFVRRAIEAGARRAVGVDKSDCILGARKLAKGKEEFWQTNVDSPEFRRFCPKFDIVLLLSVITHLRDKEEFLDWLDSRIRFRLIFESNHGEPNKKHIELVRKHIYFDKVEYLGASDIPEKPHYLWMCEKVPHELRYTMLKGIETEFVPVNKIIEKDILDQKNRYDKDSEKYKALREDIKNRGIREPLILQERKGLHIFQGGHRLEIAKELKMKEVPCKILRGFTFKHLKQC